MVWMRVCTGVCTSVWMGLIGMPLGAEAQDLAVFDCTVGARVLRIDLQGDLATYSFGPAGAPELTISAAPRELNYVPWDGWGREMPQMVEFQNADTVYQVWYSVQKMLDENEPLPQPAGGVRVMQGGQIIADLVCTGAPHVYDLERIFDAKVAAGQCFNWDGQIWMDDCAGQ